MLLQVIVITQPGSCLDCLQIESMDLIFACSPLSVRPGLPSEVDGSPCAFPLVTHCHALVEGQEHGAL